jgi:DNA-directed RNA polymerase specialized sigma24 family protein
MRPSPHEQKQEQTPSTLDSASSLRELSLCQSDDPLREYLSPAHLAVLRAEGSYEDIAAQLKIPVGTVRSRLSRARTALSQLRASLSEEEEHFSADAAFPLS